MIKIRPLLLLFLSACMLNSPVLFSANAPATEIAVPDVTVADVAVPDDVSLVEQSRQTELQAEVPSDEVLLPADDVSRVAMNQTEAGRTLSEVGTIMEKGFSTEAIASLRRLFLQAEVAIENNDDDNYFLLAGQLDDYPLYSYLQYQWLLKHLDYERQIKYFLRQYSASRYAPALKQMWLYQLAREGQWQTFLQYYSETSDASDASMTCYYRRAQFNTGNIQTALEGAKELWVVGYSQPAACDPLFAELEKTSLFTQKLLWQRFDAALGNNKTRLARYVKKYMSVADQKTAEFWLQLHHRPERYLTKLLSRPWSAQSRLMFMHAVTRLASDDVHRAIDIWDKNKSRYNISKQELEKIEKDLAFKLAYEDGNAAYARLGKLDNSDTGSKVMRIRVALYQQNWPRVIAAIEDLSAANQKLEKWQYWLARARHETGKPLQAHKLLSELADKRDFYGYLAAESLNRDYQLLDKPTRAAPQAIASIENRTAFRAAFELMVLERDKAAKRQWWHALRQLDAVDYPAAARLAQKWQWDDVAILTIAKVKQWDDIAMRFPLSYTDKVYENAQLQDLNPVILFGLIRRESAFNKDARSPSGAQGLMQIMPQTARQIAFDLDERWTGSDDLYDPVKNLQYGSYYYQKLLHQFDGHYAIALAAYNAGPNRVKKWLPDESMPADVWIETIPYRETRDYVISVLVYAMIYQQRLRSIELSLHELAPRVQILQSDELTMNDLTHEVQPFVMTP